MRANEPTGQRGRDLEGLVHEVARERISRRQFVERVLGLGLSAAAAGALLAACGGDSSPATVSPASPPPLMDTTKPDEVYLYNWSDYMAPGIKAGFEAKTGIKVVESYMDDGEALITKLKAGATGYDVMIPSDYMVSVLRRSDLIEPLDLAYVPNFANVDPQFEHPVYDDPDENAGLRYSAPFQWGTTGYAVRTDKVDPATVGAWADLWDPKFKGKINMLNDERETPAIALMKVGFEKTGAPYSINTTEQAQLDEATQALIEQKPLVRQYDSVNMRRSIVSGLPLTHCWSGDAQLAIDTLQLEQRASSYDPTPGDPTDATPLPIDYVLPSEGFPWWVDCMAIPKGNKSRYAAHLFIDYLLDAQIQARLSNWTRYLPTTSEVSRPYVDPALLALAPTADDMPRGECYDDLGEFSRQYAEAWAKVKSS